MNSTKHCFFLLYLFLAEFSISQSCLCLHFFYCIQNRITVCIMGKCIIPTIQRISKSKLHLQIEKPLTEYLSEEIVQFFHYNFFFFLRQKGTFFQHFKQIETPATFYFNIFNRIKPKQYLIRAIPMEENPICA